MEPISVILLILLLIVTVVYSYFKHSFTYWKSKGVPCDEPTIPYGSMEGLGKTAQIAEITRNLYEKYKSKGERFCGFYSLTRPSLFLVDLDLVKQIFIRDFSNFNERNLYYNEDDDPLSANLVTFNGEKWKRLRNKVTPAFSSARMKLMFPTVVGIADRLRDCLNEKIQKDNQIEIKDLLARFGTDTIGTCAFGVECNSLKDPNAEFRRHGFNAFKKFPSFGYFAFLVTFKNLARKLHLKLFAKDVSEFFLKMVRDTIDYRETNHVNRNDFMNLLMELKNRKVDNPDDAFTFNELAAQAFVFFLAGFETTATTLAFCLHEISLNPEIQTKARNIIQQAYQKHNGQFTYEMLMDMPYLEQMIEESLRKYAPTAVLSRKVNEDYRIPGTDIVLDKGTAVIIPVHGIHYDPEFYPDPEKFDPDRFSSEEKMKRDPMTFLAFGEGPRTCIGSKFAYMQARIALVTLLSNFEFSIGSKTAVPAEISKTAFLLTPQGDMFLQVKSLKST